MCTDRRPAIPDGPATGRRAHRLRLAALAAAALSVWQPQPAPAQDQPAAAVSATRQISGTLRYPQRIALPASALLVVEFVSPQGAVLATARSQTDGRQVPLAFTLPAAPARDGILRAGIFDGGRAIWLSDPVRIGPGTQGTDLGEIPLHPFTMMGFATAMRCGDTLLEVGFIDDIARLRANGRTWDLEPAPAASGSRFETADRSTVFWSSGNNARVTLAGTDLPECAPVPAQPAFPLSASGHDPAWTLSIAQGTLTLNRPGAEPVTAPLPQATGAPEGAWRFDLHAQVLSVTLTPGVCRDDRSGTAHPFAVSVAQGDEAMTGCGGEPSALLTGGEWRVTALAGVPLPEGIAITLGFEDSNGLRVAGQAGCNRYFGTATLQDGALRFGQVGATMMACPDAQMQAERHFLSLLSEVDAFAITMQGQLVLQRDGEPILNATR